MDFVFQIFVQPFFSRICLNNPVADPLGAEGFFATKSFCSDFYQNF